MADGIGGAIGGVDDGENMAHHAHGGGVVVGFEQQVGAGFGHIVIKAAYQGFEPAKTARGGGVALCQLGFGLHHPCIQRRARLHQQHGAHVVEKMLHIAHTSRLVLLLQGMQMAVQLEAGKQQGIFRQPFGAAGQQQAVEGGSGGFFWLGLLLLAALLAVHWFSPLNSFSLISVSSAGIGGRGVWAM